jgi:hypothetical protein
MCAQGSPRRGRNVSDNTSISAVVSGGTVGVAGATHVHIENLILGTPPPETQKPAGPIPPPPYPGLTYFTPKNANFFFGRDHAIRALIASVEKRSFTAFVGASGTGKSSVVLAGLVPKLSEQGSWCSTYFRIGTDDPFTALARALAPLLGDDEIVDRMMRVKKLAQALSDGHLSLSDVIGQCRIANPGKRVLLIADQFEETFTLVPDEKLRNRFIDELIAAFPDPIPGKAADVCLVLTMRADFYNAALRYRRLADRLQDHVENLGPMTRDELREAIVKPAEAVNVGFEPGLVDKILADVEKGPGTLPLMQFALLDCWLQLKSPIMTHAHYDAIGGVEGALARRAEIIFNAATDGGKNQAAVAVFRRLFTRLITLGEDAEATRRTAGHNELGSEEWKLAQKLAGEGNRLVVTTSTAAGQETVEVVHEALIRNWPTLVDWINQDRGLLSWRTHLKPRLNEWLANRKDEGSLLRGVSLSVAQDWFSQRGEELNDEEKALIGTSVVFNNGITRRSRILLTIFLGVGILTLIFVSYTAPAGFGIVVSIFQLLTASVIFYLSIKSYPSIVPGYIIPLLLTVIFFLFVSSLYFSVTPSHTSVIAVFLTSVVLGFTMVVLTIIAVCYLAYYYLTWAALYSSSILLVLSIPLAYATTTGRNACLEVNLYCVYSNATLVLVMGLLFLSFAGAIGQLSALQFRHAQLSLDRWREPKL